MVKPTLAPLTCDDALVYEPSDFYQALSAVVTAGFTPKEKAKDEHFNLLIDSLGQVTSPTQLAPLAAAILAAGVTAMQRQILWARFNGLLESMQPDDRSFGASLTALSAVNTPGVQASLEKYRQKNHGCATDAAPSPSSGAQTSKKSSTPKLDRYWQSASSQQLLEAGRKLRYVSNGQLLTDADRAMPEWQQLLADYLNLIAGWTQDQGGIRRRLLSREVPRLYGSARSGATGPAERQDPGRLRRFRQQFQPLPAKPRRMVRGTAHHTGPRLKTSPRNTLRCWRLSRTRAIPFWRWK